MYVVTRRSALGTLSTVFPFLITIPSNDLSFIREKGGKDIRLYIARDEAFSQFPD